MTATAGLTSWCEVEAAALASNTAQIRAVLSPGSLLGVVVKADAYGHGLALCAREFVAAGADWLIVNSAAEATRLRHAGLGVPLYVCGWVPPAAAAEVAASGARVVVSGEDEVRALARAGRATGRPVPVHVKLETGTHRQGLALPELVDVCRLIRALDGVCLEGLTTHYADIEDTTDHAFAREQLCQLRSAVDVLGSLGMAPPMVHSANSAATLLWPETHASLVRVGIAAYGLWPSRETYATALQRSAGDPSRALPRLRPALSWRARLAQVKDLPAGSYVGYGRTYRATHRLRLAVLPVGYHEGYDRRLSNVGHVLVEGMRAPVRGRVCMNMTMVDVTHVPGARTGGVATLLGRDGEEEVSAEQWASWTGSISYEALSRLHPEQPRLLRGADGRLVPA